MSKIEWTEMSSSPVRGAPLSTSPARSNTVASDREPYPNHQATRAGRDGNGDGSAARR